MIDHTDDHAEDTPPKRRRRRPDGRWTNPASPLQAARLTRKEGAKTVVMAIRKLCPGHGGEPCRLDVSKVSDYESKRRRPSIEHIEAFCRYYGRSPEDLGLINWRDEPPPETADVPPPNPATPPRGHTSSQEQLVLDWLCDSAVSVGAVVLRALAQCPIDLTTAADSSEPAKGAHDARTGEDDPPDATPVPQ